MNSFMYVTTTAYIPLVFLFDSNVDNEFSANTLPTVVNLNKQKLYYIFSIYIYVTIQWFLAYTRFLSWTSCIHNLLNLLILIITNTCILRYFVCKENNECFDYMYHSYICTHLLVSACININFIYKSIILSHGHICPRSLIYVLNGLILLVAFVLAAECLYDVTYYIHYWIIGCTIGCMNAFVVSIKNNN